MGDQDNTSENSEKRPKRKTWKWIVFAIIALPIAWWVFLGEGIKSVKVLMGAPIYTDEILGGNTPESMKQQKEDNIRNNSK
ncbi:MAG: hypothetical protein ACRBDL_08800 [Alphaproteobacteria bacterium]